MINNWKDKVKHYFDKFEEAGLYARDQFDDDGGFVFSLYFHYQNVAGSCAGLTKDPDDLMCWSCRKWYDYVVEATEKKYYRDRMGGIKKKHLDYLTELVKQKGVDDEK